MTIRDSLAQVVALVQKVSPGAWIHRESKYDGDTYIVQAPHPTNHVLARYNGDGDGYSQQEVDNAAAIAAAVNFLREHGPELMKMLDRHGAGDADRSAELTTAWMAGVERERDQAAEAWLPIESAPRDGSKVLLYHSGYKSAFYQRDHAPRVWVDVFRQGSWYNTAPSGQPTHWRPLPAPPTDDAARAGEGGGKS